MKYLLLACAIGFGFGPSLAVSAAPPSGVPIAGGVPQDDEAQWDTKRDLHACSHLLDKDRAVCVAGSSGHPALAEVISRHELNRREDRRRSPAAQAELIRVWNDRDADGAATDSELDSAPEQPQSRATLDAERFEHSYRDAVDKCASPEDKARDECAGVRDQHPSPP